jgi:hypothetical protein
VAQIGGELSHIRKAASLARRPWVGQPADSEGERLVVCQDVELCPLQVVPEMADRLKGG